MRFVLAFLLVTSTAAAQTATRSEVVVIKPTTEQLVETDRARLWTAASPALRVKLDAPIKALLAKSGVKPKPGERPINLVAESRKLATGILGAASSGIDIEALTMLIMAQAARDAQDDLRALLDEMKKQNEQKKAERALAEELARKAAAARERAENLQKQTSNLQKKLSETQSSIIANMK